MTFPTRHRAKLHGTNPLERLDKEVRRRADVVGIIHLVGAVPMEANDEWQVLNRYMQIEGMDELYKTIDAENTLLNTPKAA